MKTEVPKPDDFELELLESQGGNISPLQFSELLTQLQKSCSLDHTDHPVLGTTLGERDLVYVVLRKGYIYEYDENGFFKYTGVMKGMVDYWLAGFGYLRCSQDGHGGGNTADIMVSLLPRARNMGYGRFLVQKLIQHAFDALLIHRVTASIVCPVRSHYTTSRKKQVLFNTKQLCWMFQRFGFMFEGVTRGAIRSSTIVEGEVPMWHDVHRMSLLQTDYFGTEGSYTLSNTHAFPDGTPKSATEATPWEFMIQRQEEEKRDIESWAGEPTPNNVVFDGEGYGDEYQSDDGTVIGDDDSDWEIPDDFED